MGSAQCGGEYLVQADTSRTQLQQQVLIKQLQLEVANGATHRQDLEQQLRVTSSDHSYHVLSCCIVSGHSYTAADTSSSIGNRALVAQVTNQTVDMRLQTPAGRDVCAGCSTERDSVMLETQEMREWVCYSGATREHV